MTTDRAEIIDLRPVTTRDGQVEWVAENAPPTDQDHLTRSEVTVGDGKVHHDLDGHHHEVSTIPTERMAAGSRDWNEIIDAIRAAESGQPTDKEVVVEPGGKLVAVERGQAGSQLSTVPEDRMAAPARATSADLAEARRLDPENQEGWRFVADHQMPGLTFTLTPVEEPFLFFCFRCPTIAGRWYLTVLDPNLDNLTGHRNHVDNVYIGGERIPVVCSGPRDSSHASLRDVRGAAGKFALYHSLRKYDEVPFSI